MLHKFSHFSSDLFLHFQHLIPMNFNHQIKLVMQLNDSDMALIMFPILNDSNMALIMFPISNLYLS